MAPLPEPKLPQTDHFYGGKWHAPLSGRREKTYNPGNGKLVTDQIAWGDKDDVDAAVKAAQQAFPAWAATPALQRASYLRKAAEVLRAHDEELALIDAVNTGNPVKEMKMDANVGAAQCDYFAGLIPMIKGETIPVGEDCFNYTVKEPLGVVARIVAYNHPLMFSAGKMAAPLAAGNCLILKPPDQAPLSTLRLAELVGNIFPPGVFNVVCGGRECGQALTTHPSVDMVTLIGSVPTGIAIQKAAAEQLKPTILELGGKNALIAFPDADPAVVAEAAVRGMNFTWAGQSCGSTSRVFLHESLHDKVIPLLVERLAKVHKCGVPTDPDTTMGPLISTTQRDKVLHYIQSAKDEGAKLEAGGKAPTDAAVKDGYFIEPTIFSNVHSGMKVFNEEIFGPVCSIIKWTDEDDCFKQVNQVPYGLTAAIYTNDISKAVKAARKVQSGYVWINNVGRHYLGVPFGGYKYSGVGREESLEELLSFTQTKSVNVNLL